MCKGHAVGRKVEACWLAQTGELSVDCPKELTVRLKLSQLHQDEGRDH